MKSYAFSLDTTLQTAGIYSPDMVLFPLVECPKTKHSKNDNEKKSKQALNDPIFMLYDFLMIILVIYLKIYFEG